MRCVDLIVSIQATVLNDWIGLIEDLRTMAWLPRPTTEVRLLRL